jgi:hypothetical protein
MFRTQGDKIRRNNTDSNEFAKKKLIRNVAGKFTGTPGESQYCLNPVSILGRHMDLYRIS